MSHRAPNDEARTTRVCVHRHVRARSQNAHETYTTFNYPNTSFDSDTKRFNNAHNMVKIATRTRLVCISPDTDTHTQQKLKKKKIPDHTVSMASVGFSWNVIFGRHRGHAVTYRATTVTTGDNAVRQSRQSRPLYTYLVYIIATVLPISLFSHVNVLCVYAHVDDTKFA